MSIVYFLVGCVCMCVCVCTHIGFFCLLNNSQVIRVRGWQPHEFFNSNYLFLGAAPVLFSFRLSVHNARPIYIYLYTN